MCGGARPHVSREAHLHPLLIQCRTVKGTVGNLSGSDELREVPSDRFANNVGHTPTQNKSFRVLAGARGGRRRFVYFLGAQSFFVVEFFAQTDGSKHFEEYKRRSATGIQHTDWKRCRRRKPR